MIERNEHGDFVWREDNDPPDFVDEPAAMSQLYARLPERERNLWETHVFMLTEDDDVPNYISRQCDACGAWYEIEWAMENSCTMTLSVSAVRLCGGAMKMEQNVVRTYELGPP